MIPKMMLFVHITSHYDSLDDVILYPSHRVMVLKMMLFVHIISHSDSLEDVICTHYITL